MQGRILSELEEDITKNFKNGTLQNTMIVVLFGEVTLPKFCVRMPRDPEPQCDIKLTNGFVGIFLSAAKNNRSIQDGAIMIRMDCNPPILKGFSFRLYPPPLSIPRERNMGSGYNSALDFSCVDNVLCVYLINKTSVRKFIRGREIVVCLRNMVDAIPNKEMVINRET